MQTTDKQNYVKQQFPLNERKQNKNKKKTQEKYIQHETIKL